MVRRERCYSHWFRTVCCPSYGYQTCCESAVWSAYIRSKPAWTRWTASSTSTRPGTKFRRRTPEDVFEYVSIIFLRALFKKYKHFLYEFLCNYTFTWKTKKGAVARSKNNSLNWGISNIMLKCWRHYIT